MPALDRSKYDFKQILKKRLTVRIEELRLQAIARRERAERARLLACNLIPTVTTAEEIFHAEVASTLSVDNNV